MGFLFAHGLLHRYLEEGGGAPTLVADQRFGDGALADRGWLAHPKQGRLLLFDGSLLHGVRLPPLFHCLFPVLCRLLLELENQHMADNRKPNTCF